MICERCQHSIYECEGWEWFLVGCKKEKKLTEEELRGYINHGLDECKQYKKAVTKSG